MPVPLTFALLPASGGTATLRVRGEVDLTCAEDLREAATSALARHTGLTLDVSGAYFFDAAAVRALNSIHREAARLHKPAPTLHGVRPQLAKMLRLTGTDHLYPAQAPAPHTTPAAVDSIDQVFGGERVCGRVPGEIAALGI